ncbi:MAG: hypothetical protein F6K36_20950 [Symploca sp. SIO3C6]|nr:hypothetical protein [Symploca sp. SIO3C6]
MNKHLCPCCCSEPLLRHISHRGIYWFCRHCHLEVPDLEEILETKSMSEHQLRNHISEYLDWGEVWRHRELQQVGAKVKIAEGSSRHKYHVTML